MKAQAPGETQQRMDRARGAGEGEKERKPERRREQNTNGHVEKKVTQRERKTATSATQKAAALGLGPPPQLPSPCCKDSTKLRLGLSIGGWQETIGRSTASVFITILVFLVIICRISFYFALPHAVFALLRFGAERLRLRDKAGAGP